MVRFVLFLLFLLSILKMHHHLVLFLLINNIFRFVCCSSPIKCIKAIFDYFWFILDELLLVGVLIFYSLFFILTKTDVFIFICGHLSPILQNRLYFHFCILFWAQIFRIILIFNRIVALWINFLVIFMVHEKFHAMIGLRFFYFINDFMVLLYIFYLVLQYFFSRQMCQTILSIRPWSLHEMVLLLPFYLEAVSLFLIYFVVN